MIALSELRRAPAIDALRRSLDHGVFTLSGLTGIARLLAPLAAVDASRPICFVFPREKQAEEAATDLATLCGADRVAAFPAPFRTAARGPSQEEQERNRSVLALQDVRPRAIVVSVESLLVPVAAPEVLDAQRLRLKVGEELLPDMLLEHLARSGYRREDPVVEAGAFARRGGIIDVFGAGRDWPFRIEFFGDRIESIRAFDPATQRRREDVAEAEILPWGAPGSAALVPIPDILPGHVRVVIEPDQAALELKRALAEHLETIQGLDEEELAASPRLALVPEGTILEFLSGEPRIDVASIPVDGAPGTLGHVASRPTPRYQGDLARLKADLSRGTTRTVFFMGTEGRQQRLKEVLFEAGFAVDDAADGAPSPGDPSRPRISVLQGHLSSGVEFNEQGLTILADGDVFPEEAHAHRRRRVVSPFLSDFRDLRPGDFVVHEDHGVGRFERLETLEVLGASAEFMVVSYQGGDLLRVPVDSFHRIQKHRGADAQPPQIDRLGGASWAKTKARVRRAMRDMAAELLKLHAERKSRPGHAFAAESPWMTEFEHAFEYEETPDQKRAIEDVARDMAAPAPMDRLICGDVGYGKTEVAMRAAMRAVADSKQVAVLAPTTVLAFQHLQTFRRRFAPFPVTIEMVSRLRTGAENADVLARAREGRVDIVIGTHRLLSKDATFKDLGLVIVDEEQRFGVAAKEKLKIAKTSVDCLTLSATPIPRTLQMGLSGLRDMSVIETPPRDRIAIQTMVVKFSKDLIASAIRHELDRDGQVYVVHNRVESIYSLASLVRELVPEASVAVGHGALSEAELERTMIAFVEGRANVLVATTIVENGLDVPRANTLIVHRADRFGLAQLYQLRGRVGRSDRAAFAYLMVPPGRVLSEVATKRLAAIREFSDLGSGFRLAALDLEMRGAGNLLGGEQSGHILAVGLDLYLKLLAETVRELQTGAADGAPDARAALNLKVDLRLPAAYVPEARDRIALYKRAADARRDDEIDRLASELRDRFGPLTPEAADLLDYARARIEAEDLGIVRVDRGASKLDLTFGTRPAVDPGRLSRLLAAWPGARFQEGGRTLTLPLAPGAPVSETRAVLARLRAAHGASL